MTWNCNLQDLAVAIGGQIISEGPREFSGVSTDGRADNKGKIFFALKGETFDAHNFLDQAIQSGASALVIHKEPAADILNKKSVSIIRVNDTLTALQDFGRWWRKKNRVKVVAVTGTNGKTTTKEFAAVLISEKYRTHWSKGSFNNHFGVPITLLGIDSTTEVCICEMGMNHPGELEVLCKIAEPDAVVVTTVGRGHLEGLGSIEAVANAKEEIYKFSPDTAMRIFNLDNSWTKKMSDRSAGKGRRLTFSSSDSSANVSLKEVISTLDYLEISGRIEGEPGKARIPVFGRQNVNNLMAAAAMALAVGVEPDVIWRALPKCKTAWGRNQILRLKSGARMVFDGYNANPDSMAALLENFSRLSVNGKKLAVLGQMLELGSQSGELHRELGRLAGRAGFDFVWFQGANGDEFGAGMRDSGFSKKQVITNGYEQEVASQILSMLQPDDVILIKGSRGMKLERVAKALEPENFEGNK